MVFIVVIVLSVISCVAACVWRFCIQKGRKQRAAQAKQQTAGEESSQRFPQGRSQRYGPKSNMSNDQTYGRPQSESAMQDIDMESNLRPGKLNVPRRFETIPEVEDIHEDYGIEHEPTNHPDLQNSSVSPRKGYFYNPDKAGGHS